MNPKVRRWRTAMRIICMSRGHRWAFAGGGLEYCSRCGELKIVPGEKPR